MLVLSRRQNEKVNFPTLGVTIEVLRTGSKKVQLGIDAPAEIRVVRDELAWREDEPTQIDLSQTTANAIRHELQSVAMAIRLSQNQLQQGLIEQAEMALDDAINGLQQLESCLSSGLDKSDTNQVVRETQIIYRVSRQTTLRPIVDQWLWSNFCVKTQI